MSFFDYQNYYEEVSKKQYKTYVEVGCWRGESISYLANCLRERWSQVRIYAVDCFDTITNEIDPIFYKTGEYWKEYEQELIAKNVRNKVNDIKSLSWDAAEKFNDRDVEFVFLDACKNEMSMDKDLQAWWPKISGWGVLAGHDVFKPSVHCALTKFCNKKGREFKTHPNGVWEIV